MEKRIANSINELIEFWKEDIKIEVISIPEENIYEFDDDEDGFKDIVIDFELFIPFEEDKINEMEGFLSRNIDPYKFKNCVFKKEVKIYNRSRQYFFAQNCIFDKLLKIRIQKSNITLLKCSINNLDCENAIFGTKESDSKVGKTRFHNCDLYKTNFNNATFNELADFWHSTFHEKVIFYKTDFLATTVFSGVTFKENVLFTYTLIDEILILRGTRPLKGFDLALTILSGKLNLFDFKLRDFDTFDIVETAKNELNKSKDKQFLKIYEFHYENSVSDNAYIPLKNKRETYGILKNHFESQRNISESLKYKLLEKETLRKELSTDGMFYSKEDSFKVFWYKFRYNVSRKLDKFNLELNRLSNNHGTSYGRAFIFVTLVGWLFFYFSLIATDTYQFSFNISEWEFTKGLEYFIQFLIPTHKFNYMGEDVSLTAAFYIMDFIGRTFVGYGIYQFIQAFRKFR